MKGFFSGFKKKIKGKIPLNEGQIKEILVDKNIIISKDTKRENRIPSGQHEVKKWPVLHAGRFQNINNNE